MSCKVFVRISFSRRYWDDLFLVAFVGCYDSISAPPETILRWWIGGCRSPCHSLPLFHPSCLSFLLVFVVDVPTLPFSPVPTRCIPQTSNYPFTPTRFPFFCRICTYLACPLGFFFLFYYITWYFLVTFLGTYVRTASSRYFLLVHSFFFFPVHY